MADHTNFKRADSSVDQLNIWEYAKQKMEQESKTQDISRTFVILGDKGVGKTSVIENIGAISKSSKDMTLGLQYSYSQHIYYKKTITSKFYEVNGGVQSSALIRFPFDKKNFLTSCIILVVDMSDPDS